ncbi:MAG: WcaI family glycosyltransferase [Truepera sp.]|nr:WcaI family glycosyltransferase [Truepera sp.]
MKLLIFGTNYAPEPTGTGKYTSELAAWLAGRGHAVEVLTAVPHYPAWSVNEAYRGRGFIREEIDKVQVLRTPLLLPKISAGSLGSRIVLESSFNAAALRWWVPFLARRQHDAVLAICPPLQTALWPWLYQSLHRVPWIFHLQDLQIDAALQLHMLPLPKLLERRLFAIERFFLRRSTRVSTITGRMRERLIEKGVAADNLWLLPNWADIDFVHPQPRLNPLRERLGFGGSDIVVLYSGSMGEKQGLDIVLDAAGRLAHNHRLRFVLVGEGPARTDLEERAKRAGLSNVYFFDLFAWDEVPSLLATGDIHLVVQKREAADLVMPSKLTNILAAGRVSIATADPDTELHRVLNDHRAGILVPPGDSEQLAGAIERLAEDPNLRAEYGANARRCAEQQLDKGAILERLESRLLSLIGSPQ